MLSDHGDDDDDDGSEQWGGLFTVMPWSGLRPIGLVGDTLLCSAGDALYSQNLHANFPCATREICRAPGLRSVLCHGSVLLVFGCSPTGSNARMHEKRIVSAFDARGKRLSEELVLEGARDQDCVVGVVPQPDTTVLTLRCCNTWCDAASSDARVITVNDTGCIPYHPTFRDFDLPLHGGGGSGSSSGVATAVSSRPAAGRTVYIGDGAASGFSKSGRFVAEFDRPDFDRGASRLRIMDLTLCDDDGTNPEKKPPVVASVLLLDTDEPVAVAFINEHLVVAVTESQLFVVHIVLGKVLLSRRFSSGAAGLDADGVKVSEKWITLLLFSQQRRAFDSACVRTSLLLGDYAPLLEDRPEPCERMVDEGRR